MDHLCNGCREFAQFFKQVQYTIGDSITNAVDWILLKEHG
jgi:hypothetical protein